MEKVCEGKGERERSGGREGEYGSGHLANYTLLHPRGRPWLHSGLASVAAAVEGGREGGCEKITFPVDRNVGWVWDRGLFMP